VQREGSKSTLRAATECLSADPILHCEPLLLKSIAMQRVILKIKKCWHTLVWP
jgi:hypothetical protein